ncbi:hypothetical protein Tco_0792502 [Tanacetum coccineum]
MEEETTFTIPVDAFGDRPDWFDPKEPPVDPNISNPTPARIRDYDMLNGLKVPTNLKTYDGTSDSDDHLTIFMGTMDVHKLPELEWCRFFHIPLSKKVPKTQVEILGIRQRSDESLRDYLSEFGKETLHITDRSDGMMTGAFISGLRLGRLFKDLIAWPPKSMEDLFIQAHNFIRADKANIENWLCDSRWADNKRGQSYRDTSRRPRDRHITRPNGRPDERSNTYIPSFTPLLKSPAEIYATFERRNDRLSHLERGAKAQNSSQDATPSITAEKGKDHVDWKQRITETKAINKVLMTDGKWSQPCHESRTPQPSTSIAFSNDDKVLEHCNRDNPIIIKANIGGCQISWPLRIITAPLTLFDYIEKGSKTIMTDFMIVRALSPYNVILGRPRMRQLGAVASTVNSLIKFLIQSGVVVDRGDVLHKIECAQISRKRDQPVAIGANLSPRYKEELRQILSENLDVFAWSPSEHKLNIHARTFPIRQKKRVLAKERNEAITQEVAKLVEARILKEVSISKKKISNYSSFQTLRSSCNEDMVKYEDPQPSTTQTRALNERFNKKISPARTQPPGWSVCPPAESLPPAKRLCRPALGAHVFHFTLEETWIIKKDLYPLN